MITRLTIGTFLCALLLLAVQPPVVNAGLDYNQRIRFEDDFDSCAGERVLIRGVQHILGRMTTDGTGRTHFGFSRNTQGSGWGYSSGATYVLVDAVAFTSVAVQPGQAQIFTQEYHSRFVRLGESTPHDDTLVHFLTRITINANGEMAASVEIQDVSCN